MDTGLVHVDNTCPKDDIHKLLEVTLELKEGYGSMEGELEILKYVIADMKVEVGLHAC